MLNIVFGSIKKIAPAAIQQFDFPSMKVEKNRGKGTTRRVLFNKSACRLLELDAGVVQELLFGFAQPQQENEARLFVVNTAEFIKEVTDGLLPPPQYFPLNVKMNKEGYEDIESVIESGTRPLSPEAFEIAANENAWWSHSEKVVGIKPDVLFSDSSKYKYDRSYTYKMQMSIPNTGPAAYVILNFATPDDVNAVAASSKKYVIPHFKKNMSDNGMVGWGMATKITPQGQEYSSMMTYDSYDSLKNAMKHLAGEGINSLRYNSAPIISPIEDMPCTIRHIVTIQAADIPI